VDLKSLQAMQHYGAAKTGVAAADPSENSLLKTAGRDFTQTMQQAEAVATQAMTGNADPHALVEALANSQLAVETAVTVRDRVVEAYQEILRMPV